MPRKKVPYKEGDWFLVPISGKGYGVGIIARCTPPGAVFGYFFSPSYREVPTLTEAATRHVSEAVLIRKFTDLGLLEEGWPIIGNTLDWNRDEWPLTPFGYVDDMDPSVAFQREYDENRLSRGVRDFRITPDEARKLPRDGYSGHRALQGHLSKLLLGV